jgi:hypothetical protein
MSFSSMSRGRATGQRVNVLAAALPLVLISFNVTESVLSALLRFPIK